MKDYLHKNQKAYSAIAPFYKSGDDWYSKDGYIIDAFLNNLNSSAKILSVGSGTGYMENYISQKGFDVTGIDIAESMVSIASQNFPNCKFLVMNGEELDFQDNYFDAIVSRYASQHLDLDKFLSEIDRVVKSSGHIWLMTHTSKDNKPEVIEFGWNEIQDKAVMMLHTKREIINSIDKLGTLNVIKVEEYPERSKLMNDTLFLLSKEKWICN